MTFSVQAARQTIADFQWEKRLLVIFAPSAQAADLTQTLQKVSAELLERDLGWLVLTPVAVTSNLPQAPTASLLDDVRKLDKRPHPENIEVILIGKDGGVKSREAALDLPRIFGRIDAMPMRRAEIRREKGTKGS